MKNHRLVLALALALAWTLAGTGHTLAQAPSGSVVRPVSPGTQARLSRRELIKRLELTPDQKRSLRRHKAAYRKTMAEIEGQLKVRQVEMENELDKPDPDQSRLDDIIQKIADLYGRKLEAQVKAKLELERNILTPQQVELLKSLQGRDNPAANDNL